MLNISQIKPVRESITEALQLWKKLAGKGDGSSDEHQTSSHGRGRMMVLLISIPMQ